MSEDIKAAIAGYIVGDIDDATRARVEQWVGEDPGNREFYIELQEAWNASVFIQNRDGNSTEAAYKMLESRLGIRKTVPLRRKYFYYAAAAVVTGILAGTVFYQFNKSAKTENTSYVKSIYVAPGNKQKIVLKDSTVVWLNSGSVLQLSSGFGVTSRTVYLEGEGYFEVRSHKLLPAFVVQTKHYTIRDIGTIFNISTYSTDSKFEAAVIEGEISIEGKFPLAEKKSKIFLKKNDVLKIGMPGMGQVKSVLHPVAIDSPFLQIVEAQDVKNYGGWKDDLLVFEDESFRDLARALERKYKVTILIKDENIADYRYSGSFNGISSIQSILDILKETTPANYLVKGDTIIIESKK